jgi:hypothetical protein
MVLEDELGNFYKALFKQGLVLDIKPDEYRVAVFVPCCLCYRRLYLAYPAKSMQGDHAAAIIAGKRSMYFLKLILPTYELMHFCNSAQTD